MKTKTVRGLLALPLLAVAAVVAACGGSSEKSEATATANRADRAFVAQMIPHHEMAVEMARTAQKEGGHAEIKTTATAIVTAQEREVAELRTIARRLGVKPASMPTAGMEHDASMMEDADALGLSMDEMGMSADMDSLTGAKPFDRAFIDAMVPHHQGAIRMARAELAKGSDAGLRTIARAIVAAQAKEIRQMNGWRTDWYGKPSPAGGVPSV